MNSFFTKFSLRSHILSPLLLCDFEVASLASLRLYKTKCLFKHSNVLDFKITKVKINFDRCEKHKGFLFLLER